MGADVLISPKNKAHSGNEPYNRDTFMAKTCMIVKAKRPPKFKVRSYHRCQTCGRSRGFLRKFGLCRICFRTFALQGKVPGVTKSSW